MMETQGASKGEKGNWEHLAQWPEPKSEKPLLCSSPPRCYRDCALGSSAAWPLRGLAGGGRCPTAARRGAGAQPGPLARAAPPLAVALAPPLEVALAPPSQTNHDVKGDATSRNAESTFPRKRRRIQRGLPPFLRHYAMVRASQRGLDQSEGRMRELTFIKLSVLLFLLALQGRAFCREN